MQRSWINKSISLLHEVVLSSEGTRFIKQSLSSINLNVFTACYFGLNFPPHFGLWKIQLPLLSNRNLKGTSLLFQLQRDSDYRKYFTRIVPIRERF